jgi:hypothetical protein
VTSPVESRAWAFDLARANSTSLAGADDVLVSRTVRDLVAGSGLTFVDGGTYALKGVPDKWEVLEAIE